MTKTKTKRSATRRDMYATEHIISVHEAAHWFANLHHGYRVSCVSVDPPECAARWPGWEDVTPYHAYARMTVAAAGPTATKIALGRRATYIEAWVATGSSDSASIREVEARCGVWWTAADERRVARLLRRSWQLIEDMAAELRAKRVIRFSHCGTGTRRLHDPIG